MWVACKHVHAIFRIDPQTNQVSGPPIPVGKYPIGVAVGEGSVWVTSAGDNTVCRIDPSTREVVKTIPVVVKEPRGVAVTEKIIWVVGFGWFGGFVRISLL